GDGEPAVRIARPLDGELADRVAFSRRPQDHFDVEHEAVRYALAVQLPGDVASVDFEAALRVRQYSRYPEHSADHTPEQPGRNAARSSVLLEDVALDVAAGAVGDFAPAGLDHLNALEGVAVGDAQATVGEHRVPPGGCLHA